MPAVGPQRDPLPQGAAGRGGSEAEAPYGMVAVGLQLKALFDTTSHDVVPGYGLRFEDVSGGQPERLYATEGLSDAGPAALHREWRFGGRVWAVSISPPPPSGSSPRPGRRWSAGVGLVGLPCGQPVGAAEAGRCQILFIQGTGIG